jgi:hypothetical protein
MKKQSLTPKYPLDVLRIQGVFFFPLGAILEAKR